MHVHLHVQAKVRSVRAAGRAAIGPKKVGESI
jgi:hypothetical protein